MERNTIDGDVLFLLVRNGAVGVEPGGINAFRFSAAKSLSPVAALGA